MITPTDVVTQINSMLEEEFSGVNISFNDNKEGYKEPYFIVSMLSNLSNQMSQEERGHKIGMQLYYFPTDEHNYLEETLDIEQRLTELFCNGFWIQDIYIDLDENGLSFDINEGILNAIFYVNYITCEDDLDKYDNIEDFDFEENL